MAKRSNNLLLNKTQLVSIVLEWKSSSVKNDDVNSVNPSLMGTQYAVLNLKIDLGGFLLISALSLISVKIISWCIYIVVYKARGRSVTTSVNPKLLDLYRE